MIQISKSSPNHPTSLGMRGLKEKLLLVDGHFGAGLWIASQ